MSQRLKKLRQYLIQEGFQSEAALLDSFLLKKANEEYTISPGDNIERIAKRILQEKGRPDLLAQYKKLIIEANPEIESNPNALRIGQKLVIPPLPELPNEKLVPSQNVRGKIKIAEGAPGSMGQPKLESYTDHKGHLTIGWGHKIQPNEVFKKNREGNYYIDQNQANELFEQDLKVASECISRNVNKTKLSQKQFDALVSLVFNMGCEGFFKTQLFKYIDSGNLLAAADEFPTTAVTDGDEELVGRRQSEAAMFLEGTAR